MYIKKKSEKMNLLNEETNFMFSLIVVLTVFYVNVIL